MTTSSAAPRRRAVGAAAILLAAAALAGCQVDRNEIVGSIPDDYRTRHPIQISERLATIDIPVGLDMAALTPEMQATINGFARNFSRSGSGILTVMVPAGSPNARAATAISGQVGHVLRRGGVPAAAIEHRSYAASGEEFNAPIRLAYNRMAAHAGPCGVWGDQASRTHENRNYHNYGCATQQNLAAMISNPLDLMYPADSQPPDAERRANVMTAYRTGSRTQTDYSGEPASTIVGIGQ